MKMEEPMKKTKEEQKEYDMYMIEDDLKALVKAREIKMDSKRYKAAMKYGREKVEMIEEAIGED